MRQDGTIGARAPRALRNPKNAVLGSEGNFTVHAK
jgi:hypothetical protein